MKKIYKILLLTILFSACKKEVKIQVNIAHAQQNKNIKINIDNINNSDIDDIKIFIDGKEFKTLNYSPVFDIVLDKRFLLGNHQMVFIFTKDGEELKRIEKNFVLFAENSPKIYKYELVNTYPHDMQAFTQGLEFYKDTLYEGTGLYGHSSLRKEELKTGQIYKKIDLEKKYFGEGITVLNDKVYQLTWKSGIGFVYDTGFNLLKTFQYQQSKEGWGLCNDGKVLYKSDGTEKVWKLNPENLKELSYISIYTDKHKITRINEMEWVEGKIYTNVWQKNALAVIDPESGAVEGIINLSDLHKKVKQHPQLDVLNGIAYDKRTGHLFVTGKMWNKLFEIKIIK